VTERIALDGVPETMLWTLHNRASEASKPNGLLRDPRCVEIYRAIDYDYERSFGPAGPSHAVRSAIFDRLIEEFLGRFPDAVIVNLGEGLETQRYRVEVPPTAMWLSVDVPEAIAVRERFIEPDEQHRHVAVSALDPGWIAEVPQDRPVFATAQGLFMYLEPEALAELLQTLAEQRTATHLAFDHIPEWFSERSLSEKGLQKTAHYRLPPMPWGVAPRRIPETLAGWGLAFQACEAIPFPFLGSRGPGRWLHGVLSRIPGMRDGMFAISRVAGLRLASARA
jgi:O-methyltransferase involved in polyketide biosynthesis